MAMSVALAYEVAKIVYDEVGPEKGEKMLNRLTNLVIIKKAPVSPKQSVIRIRDQFLLIMAGTAVKRG